MLVRMLLISNTSEIRDEREPDRDLNSQSTITEPIGLNCFIVSLDLLKFRNTAQFRKRPNLTHLLITSSN